MSKVLKAISVKRRLLLATLLVVSHASLHGASAQTTTASPPGDAAHGKALFMADGCYECHGTVGQGGPGLRLAPSPLPPQVIGYYIRNPTGEMPPYTSKVVTDADIRDIHAYLSSIPKPPALADIPELN